MKGGGLTWIGWGMLGVGAMLIYAGMTGQSLTAELGAVFQGRKLSSAAADDVVGKAARAADEAIRRAAELGTPEAADAARRMTEEAQRVAEAARRAQGIAVGEPAPPSRADTARTLAAARAIPWPEV